METFSCSKWKVIRSECMSTDLQTLLGRWVYYPLLSCTLCFSCVGINLRDDWRLFLCFRIVQLLFLVTFPKPISHSPPSLAGSPTLRDDETCNQSHSSCLSTQSPTVSVPIETSPGQGQYIIHFCVTSSHINICVLISTPRNKYTNNLY